MPPEKFLTSWSAASVEAEALEQLVGAPPGLRLGEVVEPADHHEVRAAAHQPVDRGLLGGHTDAPPHGAGVGHHVDAGHGRRALGGRRQGGQDADGGGLAGAVVAEQAEDGAGGHVEVEVAQRPEVAVALAQAVG